MKKQTLLILACAATAILAPAAARADFVFHLDINVASLVTQLGSQPFALDFQLNQGNGLLENTVTLSSFTFSGTSAGPLDSAVVVAGDALGDMSSSISLNSTHQNSFSNEIYQEFKPGTTDIQFNVSVSQNAYGSIPDDLNVSILDDDLDNILTSDPSGGNTIVNMSIEPSGLNNTLSSVGTYTSSSPAGATANASVPEPSTAMALVGGIGMLAVFRRKRA